MPEEPSSGERRRGRKGVEAINQFIGARLRDRRKELELTQADLAELTGHTYQQIMKYEQGVNRLSAPLLWMLANLLGVPVSYFFLGLAAVPMASQENEPDEEQLLALVAKFRRMDAKTRAHCLALIDALPAAKRRR